MKIMYVISLFLVFAFPSQAQKHKATMSEAEYYNKAKVLYTSMPEKFHGGVMDDFGARPAEITPGQEMQDCKSVDCFMLLATVNYGFRYNNPGADALEDQINAIKGKDDASGRKRDILEYKLNNDFGLSVKLMVNFAHGESIKYCKASGSFQKLAPPPGWDGWYMGSMANCPDFSGSQEADASFLFIGALPVMKETAIDTEITKAVPTFPVNPSDIQQFKVKNIVLYIQGSKELVAEFVKNMDTKSLRALIQ